MPQPEGTVSTSLKLRYAIGGAAEGSTAYAFNGFNFVIYTIIFGMPGTLVGLAVFLSIALDAVSDPLVGYLSDRWKSRWGRRHSFIYASSLPLAASIFCIYSPPGALLAPDAGLWSFLGYEASPTQWALALWLFVFASSLKLFLTCYHLPHLALGSELTDDYLERTRIFRYNTLFSFSGGAGLAFAFYYLFFPGGPQPELDTSFFAASVALFGGSVIFLTAYLTREQIPNLAQPPENLPKVSLSDFLTEASVVFRNPNYMMLFYGLFCLSPMVGVRETLGQNMLLFYWELEPQQIGLLPAFAMTSYFVGAALVAPMTKRFDKGGTMRIAVGAAAIAASWAVILRSFGLLPENDSPSILYIVGLSAFVYYGSLSILTTSVFSAIGDVVDEQELASGRRQEAVFYAVRTFFAKLANGIGHLVAGVAIDVIAFPPRAVVGEVDAQVIFELGIVESIVSVLPVIGAIYFYGRYAIDKERHAEIREELAAARVQLPNS